MRIRAEKGTGSVSFRKSDGRWQAILPRKGESPKYFYGDTKEAAIKARSDWKGDPKPEPVRDYKTFGDLCRHYVGETLPMIGSASEDTIKDYRGFMANWIIPTIGEVRCDSITVQDLDSVAATMKSKGKRPNNCHTFVKAVAREGKRLGWISEDLSGLMIRLDGWEAKPAKWYEPEQLMQLIERSKGTRAETGILLCGVMGYRENEACQLEWEDCDFFSGGIQLQREKVKTATSARWVPLPKFIQDHLLSIPRTCRYILTDIAGVKAMNPDVLHREIEKLMVDCGLPVITTHQLRHTAASVLHSKGIPIKVISTILGHSDTKITERYIHAFDSGVHAAMQSLHDVYA